MSQTGDRLRELRQERDLTQERVARLAGLAVRTVARIEAGEGEVKLVTLQRLAKALGVPTTALVDETQTSPVAKPAEPVAPA